MTCLPSHTNDSHQRLRTEIRELSTEDSKNFFLFADFDSTKESQKIFEKLEFFLVPLIDEIIEKQKEDKPIS